jgi:hypothetical protein
VWFKLKWMCDIAGFIEREHSLDWDQVLGRAARLRATRKLYLGCLLAHDLLGADLPERVLTGIQREAAVHHAARTIAEKYSLSSASRRFTPHERTTLYFRTADPGDKVSRLFRYMWRSLRALTKVSENDRQFVCLPAWLSPAYYLVRPIRLMSQFGRPRVAAKAIREMFESFD